MTPTMDSSVGPAHARRIDRPMRADSSQETPLASSRRRIAAFLNAKRLSAAASSCDESATSRRPIHAADSVAVDINLSEMPAGAKAPLDTPDCGWLESSRDLLRGLRVRETPMDTLPNDLIEAFAKAER